MSSIFKSLDMSENVLEIDSSNFKKGTFVKSTEVWINNIITVCGSDFVFF